jgi:glutamate formiminotransferase / 5-formyltetrahydrofolate cyclo-ligase
VLLESVPNVSEGEDEAALGAIARAFSAPGCELLDVHTDPDYGRTVFTLLGEPQELADALFSGAHECVVRLDVHKNKHGVHPYIGVLDVVPIVYLRVDDRETARDEALGVANRLASELDLPVFLYGELASSPDRRERAYFRDGGVGLLSERLERGEVEPDFGPRRLHPTAGGILVAARPPLVAFNFELETSDVGTAKAIAARVRERGGGLPGVRAIGVKLERHGTVELSTNVHDPFKVPLRTLVEVVRNEAGQEGVAVVAGRLVGLAPAAALDGFPSDLPLRDFDDKRHVLENRLRSN